MKVIIENVRKMDEDKASGYCDNVRIRLSRTFYFRDLLRLHTMEAAYIFDYMIAS